MVVALTLTLLAKVLAVYAPVFFGNGINLIAERANGASVDVAQTGMPFMIAFLV